MTAFVFLKGRIVFFVSELQGVNTSEPTFLYLLGKITVVATKSRKSEWRGSLPPTRSNSLVCKTLNRRTCTSKGRLPISFQN
jgi:hypothetical protein